MPGVNITSTGASAGTLIPFDATNNEAPQWIRVAVTAPGYFRVRESEGAATTADVLITPESPVVLGSYGRRFLSFISVTGTAIANVQALNEGSYSMFAPSLMLDFVNQQYQIEQGIV